MYFGYAQYVSLLPVREKIHLITNLGIDMKKYFRDKFYGLSAQKFIIGTHLFDPDGKYFSHNENIEYNKRKKELAFTINIPYSIFYYGDEINISNKILLNDKDSVIIIRDLVLNHLNKIEEAKLKDFDIESFRNDFINFFIDYIPSSDTPKPRSKEEMQADYEERERLIKQEFLSKRKFPKSKKMPYEQFWNLIEKSKNFSNGDYSNQIENLILELSKFDEKDICKFEVTFHELLLKASHYNIMAMAKIIDGYVSDDSFLYFRAGLISLGERIYTDSIKNPDSHADEFTYDFNGEEMLYVADKAYKLKGITDLNEMLLPRDYASEIFDYDSEDNIIKGKDWKEKDLPKKYPKLSEKYKGRSF